MEFGEEGVGVVCEVERDVEGRGLGGGAGGRGALRRHCRVLHC